MELVNVYTTNDPLKAQIIRNFLVGEGIACEVGDAQQMELTGLMEVDVMVRKADLERARALIEDHESIETDEDDEFEEEGEEA